MGGKAVKWVLCLLTLLYLTASALAEGSVVVIPEGVTDIPMEAYAHDTMITDLYLPASLETITGMEPEDHWSFGLVYGGNNWHPQEYKLVLHAPEGTAAAEFARRSGLPYVIEDARGGTDRRAVAAWVQAVLDAALPGAQVCQNRISLPAVAYSADSVLAAVQLADGSLSLCLFDRTGETLSLRWVNRDMLSDAVPHIMEIVADRLTIAVQLRENMTLAVDFIRNDDAWTLTELRLDEDNGVYWQTSTFLRITQDMLAPDIDLMTYVPYVWQEG